VMHLPLSEEWLPPPGTEEAARQAREKREKVNMGTAGVVAAGAAALPPA
jgi:hypothetical protein